MSQLEIHFAHDSHVLIVGMIVATAMTAVSAALNHAIKVARRT
jgi:hypothetical protein